MAQDGYFHSLWTFFFLKLLSQVKIISITYVIKRLVFTWDILSLPYSLLNDTLVAMYR